MKANYFKVGVFIALATALIVVAVVILGAGMFQQDKLYFETYFDEEISGLKPGSPVEVRGVEIGQVERVGFVSHTYDLPAEYAKQMGEARLVRVVFSVTRDFMPEFTPDERIAERTEDIELGLRLRLGSNLITGQAYLRGTYVDPNRFPVPRIPWEPEFDFVPSAPSEFTTMKDSVDKILQKVEEIDVQKLFDHVDELILTAGQAVTDANVAGLSEEVQGLLTDARHKVNVVDTEKIGDQLEDLLASADQAIGDANVAALGQQITSMVAEVRVTNQRLQGLLDQPDRDKDKANIAAAVDQLNTTLRRINVLILTQAPRIESTLENFRKVSEDLKDLTENLKQNPSDLVFSSPPSESELVK